MFEEVFFGDFQALYGPWRPLVPAQVATLFSEGGFRWWIGGGWAVDATTGITRRPHEDTDVIVLRDELPAVRSHLRGFHVWEAESGMLRPLAAGDAAREEVWQYWLRADAYSPWVLDVLLTPTEGDDWLYKRDRRIRRPLADIGFAGRDGITYLRPEIVLLFKATLGRPKDEADFRALLPHLSVTGRAFLIAALSVSEPGHPWLTQLSA